MIACSIISETQNMDGAVRIKEINEARVKIGKEPFLRGDEIIKESLEWGLCEELVLNEHYDENMQPIRDMISERQILAAAKQRIADRKPTATVAFHSNGKLKSRTHFQPKSAGGEQHGLDERWFENGELAYRTNYKDGDKDGVDVLYYQHGQLRYKRNWTDGIRDGIWESYYKSGNLESKQITKMGELEFWGNYTQDGRLSWSLCYKNYQLVDSSLCDK